MDRIDKLLDIAHELMTEAQRQRSEARHRDDIIRSMTGGVDNLKAENERLKAEVQRLRDKYIPCGIEGHPPDCTSDHK